jgi:hypothetical protein
LSCQIRGDRGRERGEQHGEVRRVHERTADAARDHPPAEQRQPRGVRVVLAVVLRGAHPHGLRHGEEYGVPRALDAQEITRRREELGHLTRRLPPHAAMFPRRS